MNKKGYALTQSGILILAILAFAFILGGMGGVSAEDNTTVTNPSTKAKLGEPCVLDTDCKDYSGPLSTIICGTISGKIGKYCITKSTQTTNNNQQNTDLTNQVINVVEGTATNKLLSSATKTATSGGLFGSSTYLTAGQAGSTVIGASTTEAGVNELVAMDALKETSWLFGKGAIGSSESFWGGAGTVILYAAIAVAAGWIATSIAQNYGASTQQSESIGVSVGAGVFVGLVVAGTQAGGPWGAAVGAAVAVVTLALTYKQESFELVKYQCLPYVAANGGDHCEECNNGNLPCTEYECKSLGRSCELLNQGTDEELCVEVGRGDVEAPQISPWENPLTEGYQYNPITTNFPEDRGVKVEKIGKETGCVDPFESINFGITLNEPAICKMSYDRTQDYESMGTEYLSYGLSAYNHSMSLTFPGRAEVEEEGYEYNEGFNEVFVRCEDARGNSNLANFVFRFCVDDTPDYTEPVVLGTKYSGTSNEALVQFNTTELETVFYVNKPSTCKWSRLDQGYEDMENTMTCAKDIGDTTVFKNRQTYACDTTLNGIQNYIENNFYVRCQSYPNKVEEERATMESSYELKLTGTRSLEIGDVFPNETVRGSGGDVIETLLEVYTLGGADEGNSICEFRKVGTVPFTRFFNTQTYYSTQKLYLPNGAYEYEIRCTDKAGNSNSTKISFAVEADSTPPLIARAYYEEGYLKLVTNEEANCVYSTFGEGYQFEDGISLETADYLNHFTSWDTTEDLYVKCQDIFLNRPEYLTENTIIVRAYEEFEEPVN